MKKSQVVTPVEFEQQLSNIRDKFALLERRLSMKTDEIVFSMTVSHRKDIEKVREDVMQLTVNRQRAGAALQRAHLLSAAKEAKQRTVG
ncbi:hypothetical protein QRD89_09970 [Halobacillus sp. ACCC02827]|uniref:hypothetical protein n=1 Tax=Bacillaceae TaxID=186817 RepID=UPI000426814F|nr:MULTISPECIES: hypothetical protein [Bacillaceae]QHT46836.1 hypothetical protein M662_10145 [Bacillus sp. SB49]WJE14057.1 hypothetical protein QRD89_09970 [Halobacillus sp. ACCC02827]